MPTEDLDLRGRAFASGATANLIGHTLALVDGTYSASFTLSGTSPSSFASAYVVSDDGHGGTLITASATMTMAQHMAAFAAKSGVGATPTISSGRSAPISLTTVRG
jgi:hypothetical protein